MFVISNHERLIIWISSIILFDVFSNLVVSTVLETNALSLRPFSPCFQTLIILIFIGLMILFPFSVSKCEQLESKALAPICHLFYLEWYHFCSDQPWNKISINKTNHLDYLLLLYFLGICFVKTLISILDHFQLSFIPSLCHFFLFYLLPFMLHQVWQFHLLIGFSDIK